MKKKLKTLIAVIGAFVLAMSVFSFNACFNEPDSEPQKIALESIAFENDEIELEAGKSVQLTLIFTPADATNKNVTYSSDDNDVCTVDANGLVTAKADADGSSCIITATAEEGNGLITAECGVTVVPDKGEAIEKTATISTATGDITNELTIYSLGRLELTATAVAGALAIPLDERFAGTYSVNDNTVSIRGSAKAMGFTFPVLSKVSFKNQMMQLRLYINNGTTDFELGTYEFTKEEAAKLKGTNNVEGGIDTERAYVLTTVTNGTDSVVIWSDGRAQVSVNALIPIGATAPMTYDTTWSKGEEPNTIVFADTEEEVDTGTVFGSGIVKTVATTNGSGITIDINVCIALNPAGQNVATLVIDRITANEIFDFNIPYVEVSEVNWAEGTVSEGKYAMVSGNVLGDINTIASFNADATADAFHTVTSSDASVVLVKENKTLVPLKAGTTTVTVTVDEKTEEIEVTVSYPEGRSYESAVCFENDTRFQYSVSLGVYGVLAYNLDFLSDGHVRFEGCLGAAVLESVWGEYTLVKENGEVVLIKVKFYNEEQASALFNDNVYTDEVTFNVTKDGNGKMTFTVTGTDDNGQPTSTEYTETEIPVN